MFTSHEANNTPNYNVTRQRSRRIPVALLLVFALGVAACGGDDDAAAPTDESSDSTDVNPAVEDEPDRDAEDSDQADSDAEEPDAAELDTPEPEDIALTASARGITDDTIHIGMAIADVTAFANTGDQKARFQEVADVINSNGGVIGRQLELHFAEWELVDTTGFDAACVELTQDIEVFAVVARVPAGFGEMTCFTVLNDHMVVNLLDLDDSEAADSGGMLFSILSDRFSALKGGVDALAPELADARIAIAGSEIGKEQAEEIETYLTGLGLEVVETTLSSITYSEDPVAALAAMELFAERWETAGATHVVAVGNAAVGAAQGLVDTGANDSIVLITSNLAVRTLTSLGADLSLLDMIGISAPEFADVAEDGVNGTLECISIIEDAGLGPVILRPEEEDLTALPSTLGACAAFDFLSAVLEAAGPNPTQDDVLALTGAGFSFEMTTAGTASVDTGKAYMNDDAGAIYDWDPATQTFNARG